MIWIIVIVVIVVLLLLFFVLQYKGLHFDESSCHRKQLAFRGWGR